MEVSAGELQPIPQRPRPRQQVEQTERPTLRVGREVFVPSLDTNGTILSVGRDNQVEVSVGGMRVQLRAADLRPAAERHQMRSVEPAARNVVVEREARIVPLELDVRGLHREQALAEVDRYLHDAFMAGLPRVRVIHGKGSGAVRAAVRDLLGGHVLVKEFQPADRTQGGDGATMVAVAI